jgi:branched-chain amino acid transport system substrate-binding protein
MALSRRVLLGAALGSLAAGGCARGADPLTGGGARESLRVGLLRPRTGDRLTVAESIRYETGFRLGLSSTTSRSFQIGVRPITVLEADEQQFPSAAAESLIDRGCRILVGGFSKNPAVRLAELAARRKVLYVAAMARSDTLTGINRYTFRDGPSETQLLTALRAYVRPGGRLAVLAAESEKAAKAASVLGAAATIVEPVTTTDFAAVAKKIKALRADQLYVDWPVMAPGLWAALPAGVQPLTVLGARATWPVYGTAAGSLRFVTPYVDTATNNPAYQVVRASVPRGRTDSGHAEGFTAAQMVVRAFQSVPQDVDAMVAGLEGYEFAGLEPGLAIRAHDHLRLGPVWGGYLTWTGAGGVGIAVPDRQFDRSETA